MNATYIYENGSLVLNGLDNGVGTYVTGSGMRRAVNVYTPSVKDYGALGNGIADDCMAFNWALGNATNVYVPPGTYIIGCSIVPPSGRTLYGDPGTATLKRIASASSSFDTISGSAAGTHDITISGNTIIGDGVNTTNRVGILMYSSTGSGKGDNITVTVSECASAGRLRLVNDAPARTEFGVISSPPPVSRCTARQLTSTTRPRAAAVSSQSPIWNGCSNNISRPEMI